MLDNFMEGNGNDAVAGVKALSLATNFTTRGPDIADYIASPVKKRPDYPEMRPQAHLPKELRLEVARYMLQGGR